jgi:hypothetical protein
MVSTALAHDFTS